MSTKPDLLAELEWRGMLQAHSDGLPARLARGPISGYVGMDPSGPSLHAGHLVQVFLLTHLQRSGGRPVALVGGGTGMIGDPAGTSAERNLLDDATLERNKDNMRRQLERFLDFSEGSGGAVMLDNREWLGRLGLLEFLRDVGKHFSLGYMLAKDSVQQRLASGLSFTEFSYMTLQATDFLHLHREHGVDLQMGGSDQWGNITAGLELIRRVEGQQEGSEPSAFALCSRLLLNTAGEKMGKTAQGAVFLDARLTSPFDFYQYWLNQDDALAGQLLRWLTLKDRAEIEALEDEQQHQPERRPAQRAFAFDITARVHGRVEAERQVRIAEEAFSGQPIRDPEVLGVLFEALDSFEFEPADVADGALRLAVASGTFASNAEARRQIAQGGLTINDMRIAAPEDAVPEPIDGEWLVVRAGKKRLRIGRRRR